MNEEDFANLGRRTDFGGGNHDDLIPRLPIVRVDAVVVGVNLLDKVGVHLVEHLLDDGVELQRSFWISNILTNGTA